MYCKICAEVDLTNIWGDPHKTHIPSKNQYEYEADRHLES